MKKLGKAALDAFLRPPAWAIGTFWVLALIYYIWFMACVVHLYYFAGAIVTYCLFPPVLGYTIYTAIISVPGIGDFLVRKLSPYKFGRRLVTDYGYRANFFGAISTAINVFYVLYNMLLYILELSVWYGTLTVAYAVLCLMRIYALSYNRAQIKSGEVDFYESYSVYMNVGIMILFYAFAFAVIVYQMVVYGLYTQYLDLALYVVIGYTIYKSIAAVCMFFNAVQYRNPAWVAIRDIVIADTIVSVVTLVYSIFARMFSEFTLVVLISGSVIGAVGCIGIALIGIVMIMTGISGRQNSKTHLGLVSTMQTSSLVREREERRK